MLAFYVANDAKFKVNNFTHHDSLKNANGDNW